MLRQKYPHVVSMARLVAEITRGHTRSHEIRRDQARSRETTRDHPKSRETTRDHARPGEITRDQALASSAPILGYPDLTSPFGWYRVATHTYESQAPGCPAAVRRAFSTLLAAGAPQLSRAYNACTPIRPTQLPRVVGWLVATLTGSLAASGGVARHPVRPPSPSPPPSPQRSP